MIKAVDHRATEEASDQHKYRHGQQHRFRLSFFSLIRPIMDCKSNLGKIFQP
jgi:hypothetical protein